MKKLGKKKLTEMEFKIDSMMSNMLAENPEIRIFWELVNIKKQLKRLARKK